MKRISFRLAALATLGALIIGLVPWASPPRVNAVEPTNLILNGSLETQGSDGLPQGWKKNTWGSNAATFTYPVDGHASSRAAKVQVTSYSGGDSKWYFNHVNVTPGQAYVFSDWYTSTTGSQLVIQYRKTDGTYLYSWLKNLPAAATWTQTTSQFTVPAGVQSLSIFHLIYSVGSLTVDDYSLTTSGTPPPPPPPPAENLVPNPSLETTDSLGKPVSWKTARSAGVTASFTYPVSGQSGAKAAKTEITAYTSGDAKWYFNHIPVDPKREYAFSNWYQSNVTSHLTVQFRAADGSLSYKWLKDLPPASGWTKAEGTFVVPNGTVDMTVLHSIKTVGWVSVDTYSVTLMPGSPVFSEGMVSFDFDDGHKSFLTKAKSIFDAAGYTTTQYMVSQYVQSNDPDYMTVSEMLALQAQGHEIGGHTRTHADLTTLTADQRNSQISGNRQDLLGHGATPVTSFAYPFGAYNATIKQEVQNAGYTLARSTNPGYNDKRSDKFALLRMGIRANVTLAQVKSWIDTAKANNTWLILVFHNVADTPTDDQTVTPALIQGIVDYTSAKNMKVITTKQAAAMMNP